MPSIWNDLRRKELEARLDKLIKELKELDEVWYGQLPHTLVGDGKVSVKVPSHRELSEIAEKREILNFRISHAEQELSRLNKRKGWG